MGLKVSGGGGGPKTNRLAGWPNCAKVGIRQVNRVRMDFFEQNNVEQRGRAKWS